MKSLRNKVIMSAIVLVFAVIATIGSTYAWFTVSNNTTTTNMTLEVASSESLLMKVYDGETYTGLEYNTYRTQNDAGNDFWTIDDFTTRVNITDSDEYLDYTSWRMMPVTALQGETVAYPNNNTDYDSIDFTALRYLEENIDTARPLVAADTDGVHYNSGSGYFLEFKFWVMRPGGNDYDVVFNYNLTDNQGLGYDQAVHIGVEGSNSDVLNKTDISFTNATNVIASTTTDLSVFQVGDEITVSGAGQAGNNSTFTVSAVALHSLTVDGPLTDEVAGSTVSIVGQANYTLFGDNLDYEYSWSNVDAGWADDQLDYVVNIDASGGGDGDSSIDTALTAIQGTPGLTDAATTISYLEEPNVPELVTVRIWIEGWDLQTTNAIMGADFTLVIEFALPNVNN